MKITEEEIMEMAELINLFTQFKPIVKLVIDGIKSYGPEIKDLLTTYSIGSDNITRARFGDYITAGFSREEAMLLILDSKASFHRALRSFSDGVKGSSSASTAKETAEKVIREGMKFDN